MADYEGLYDLVEFNQNINNEEHERIWQGIDTSNALRTAGDAAVSNTVQAVRNIAHTNSNQLSKEAIYRIEGDLLSQKQYSDLITAFNSEWANINLAFLDVQIDLQGQLNLTGIDIANLESYVDLTRANLSNLITTNKTELKSDISAMDIRIKKYENLLSDITIDSNQITIDNGDINMGAWTILSQAREWDLEILAQVKGFKDSTVEDINQALEDLQNSLPIEQDLINKAIEQLSNAPIIKELDAILGSAIEDIDTVHNDLVQEVETRHREMIFLAQATSDEIKAYIASLTADINTETESRIEALQREATIRQAQLIQEALDRSEEIDEKILQVNIDIDGSLTDINNTINVLETDLTANLAAANVRVDHLNTRADGIAQSVQDEAIVRLAAINALNDGLTTEIQYRKDGDTAGITALNNYKTTNNAALANVQEQVTATVTANSANATKITALDTRLTTNETVAASAVTIANSAVTDTSALASRVDELFAAIEEGEGTVVDVNAFNLLKADVSTLNGRVNSQGTALTGLISSVENMGIIQDAASSAVSELQTQQTATETSITQLSTDTSSLRADLTVVQGDLESKVSNQAFNELLTRTSIAEGKIEVHSSDITSLQSSLATTNSNLATKASAASVTALDSKVTTQGNTITTQGTAITKLTNDLVLANNEIDTKASSAALTTLDSKVTGIDGRVTSNSNSITTLGNKITAVEGAVSTKAEATAVNALTTRVTAAEGVNTSQGTSITDLNNSISTINGTLATKADASAVSSLTTKVTQNTDAISVQSADITRLKADLIVADNKINTKADSSALSVLDTKVTNIDGKVTTNSSAITSLTGRVTTAEGEISKKLDASAISNYYTQVEADEATAGEINKYNTSLVIGGDNLYKGINPIVLTGRSGEFTSTENSNVADQLFHYLTAEDLNINRLAVGDDTVASMEIYVPSSTNNSLQFRFAVYRLMLDGYSQSPVLSASEFPRDKWVRVSVPAGNLPAVTVSSAYINISLLLYNRNVGDIVRWRNLMIENATKPSMYTESNEVVKNSLNANSLAISNTNTTVSNLGNLVTAQGGVLTKLETSVTDVVETITIGDTRLTNEPPSWYWNNYGNRNVNEFKAQYALGVLGLLGENRGFATLNTLVPWQDASGGAILQTATATDNPSIYIQRHSLNPDQWSEWEQPIKALRTNLELKADAAALSTLDTKVSAIDGRVTTQAGQLTVLTASVNSKADSSAVSTLQVAVEAQGNSITNLSNQTTSLSNRVTSAEGNIASNTNSFNTLDNKVTAIDGRVTAQSSSITSVQAQVVDIRDVISIADTRIDNYPPNYYWTKYPGRVVNEFKESTYIGVVGLGSFVNLETRTYYPDSSGGPILQIAYSATDSLLKAERNSSGAGVNAVWSEWRYQLRDLRANVETKADATALSSLDAKVTTVDGKVTSQANSLTQLQSIVGDNTSKIAVQGSAINGIQAEYTIKLDVNGLLSGIGLINTGTSSAIGMNADFFYIGKPTNGKKPFMVLTSSQTIGGVTYPAGTWIDVALIANATIGTAHIANASITDAKIVNLNAEKITAGIINADRIGVNSITADKLIIGDTTNLWGNQYIDQRGPSLWNGAGRTSFIPNLNELKGNGLQMYGRDHVAPYTTRIPLKTGDTFMIEYSAGLNGGPSIPLNVGLWVYDRTGNTGTLPWQSGSSEVLADLGGGWFRFRRTFKVVDNGSGQPAAYGCLYFNIQQWDTDSNPAFWSVGDIVVRKPVGGELIVNGAITADKINVTSLSAISANLGTIKVGTANIDDLAVTSAKLGDLQVDTLKIKDNAVTVPVSAFAEANQVVGTEYTTIQTLNVPSDMGHTILTFGAVFSFTSYASSQQILCRVLKNGSVVFDNLEVYFTDYESVGVTSQNSGSHGHAISVNVSGSMTDAGNHNHTFSGNTQNSSAGSVSNSNHSHGYSGSVGSNGAHSHNLNLSGSGSTGLDGIHSHGVNVRGSARGAGTLNLSRHDSTLIAGTFQLQLKAEGGNINVSQRYIHAMTMRK